MFMNYNIENDSTSNVKPC